MLAAEHVGGHVGNDYPAGGQLVPVRDKVCQAQVIGNVLVPVVRLGDQQVGAVGGVGYSTGPGGVASVGDRLLRHLQAQEQGRSSTGVVGRPGADRYSAHRAGGSRSQFGDLDAEPAAGGRGAGEQELHGLTEAAGGSRRAGDGKRLDATGELPVEDEEGQAAEVVAVQVGDEHGTDLAGVESQALEGAERRGAAVQQHRGSSGAAQVDAGLVPAAAAEGVAAAGEGHGEG